MCVCVTLMYCGETPKMDLVVFGVKVTTKDIDGSRPILYSLDWVCQESGFWNERGPDVRLRKFPVPRANYKRLCAVCSYAVDYFSRAFVTYLR